MPVLPRTKCEQLKYRTHTAVKATQVLKQVMSRGNKDQIHHVPFKKFGKPLERFGYIM